MATKQDLIDMKDQLDKALIEVQYTSAAGEDYWLGFVPDHYVVKVALYLESLIKEST